MFCLMRFKLEGIARDYYAGMDELYDWCFGAPAEPCGAPACAAPDLSRARGPKAEIAEPRAETALVLAHRPGPSTALALPGAGMLMSVRTADLPRDELRRRLPAMRVGDPLGTGNPNRPPPPPDPDRYDPALESQHYSRSLLSAEEQAQLDVEHETKGFMPIETVRKLIVENLSKRALQHGLDPEFLMMVDYSINYKIFIADDNVYTREELYEHFPFLEMNAQPEAVFMPQEIGVFPPGPNSLKGGALEYVVRDVGDERVGLVPVDELVRVALPPEVRARRKGNWRPERKMLKLVQTKIYVGKEHWKDFLLMMRLMRGSVRIAAQQLAFKECENLLAYQATAEQVEQEAARAAAKAAAEAAAAKAAAAKAQKEAEIQELIDRDVERIGRTVEARRRADAVREAAAAEASIAAGDSVEL